MHAIAAQTQHHQLTLSIELISLSSAAEEKRTTLKSHVAHQKKKKLTYKIQYTNTNVSSKLHTFILVFQHRASCANTLTLAAFCKCASARASSAQVKCL